MEVYDMKDNFFIPIVGFWETALKNIFAGGKRQSKDKKAKIMLGVF